jgi:hypothetical protein
LAIDLDDATRLIEWMRAHGVIHAHVGGVELQLGEVSQDGEVAEEGAFDISTLDTSAYASPYEDPDLYPDGKVPDIDGPAPMTPKQSSEDSAR